MLQTTIIVYFKLPPVFTASINVLCLTCISTAAMNLLRLLCIQEREREREREKEREHTHTKNENNWDAFNLFVTGDFNDELRLNRVGA